MNVKYNKIIPLAIIIAIISYFGYRILNTKILPFQTVTLNCKMDGSQNFPTGELPKSIPIIKFPYKLSIELNFFTGRFINTRGYLKDKDFSYRTSGFKSKSIIFEIPVNEFQSDSIIFILPIAFGERKYLYIDYLWQNSYGWLDDGDASYKCEKLQTKKNGD